MPEGSKVLVELEEANQKLSKVKICQLKGKKLLYFRGTFPPKPGEDVPKQRYLVTGCPVTKKGISAALAKAHKIESDLLYERFNWADWSKDTPDKLTVTKAVQKFTKFFWSTRERTKNREGYFKREYLAAFSILPPNSVLTCEVLRSALKSINPTTRTRLHFYKAFKFLAREVGIECYLDDLRGTYSGGKKRDLPSDEEIEEMRLQISTFNARDNLERWRRVFELLALYGLRPHEIFRLDCSRLHEPKHPLIVEENSKTKGRVVYPIPPRWFDEWSMGEGLCLPRLKIAHLDNRDCGQKVTGFFRDQKKRFLVPISAYHLRDRYAVRCLEYGIPDAIAARWMGHNLEVHHKKYQSHMDERTDIKILDQIEFK